MGAKKEFPLPHLSLSGLLLHFVPTANQAARATVCRDDASGTTAVLPHKHQAMQFPHFPSKLSRLELATRLVLSAFPRNKNSLVIINLGFK